jgi:K+-transporting ATPase KdpF subunit
MPVDWMQILSGVVAIGLLAYLVAALIDAENL